MKLADVEILIGCNVINELIVVHRIKVGPNGESLASMEKKDLIRLLAIKQAVAE